MTLLHSVALLAVVLSGLDEERLKQKAVKDSEGFATRIKEACGTEVKLDFDWASYGSDKAALEGAPGAANTALSVMKLICRDDLGKAASKKVKSFKLSNAKSRADFKSEFKDGVVSVALPNGGGASVSYSPQIAKVISDGL